MAFGLWVGVGLFTASFELVAGSKRGEVRHLITADYNDVLIQCEIMRPYYPLREGLVLRER